MLGPKLLSHGLWLALEHQACVPSFETGLDYSMSGWHGNIVLLGASYRAGHFFFYWLSNVASFLIFYFEIIKELPHFPLSFPPSTSFQAHSSDLFEIQGLLFGSPSKTTKYKKQERCFHLSLTWFLWILKPRCWGSLAAGFINSFMRYQEKYLESVLNCIVLVPLGASLDNKSQGNIL